MAIAVLSWTSWPNLKEAPLLSLRKIKGTFLDRAKLGRCFDSHRGLQSEAIRTAWSPMYGALVRLEAKLGANGVNGGVVGAIGVTGGMRSRTRVTSFTPIANCCYKNIQKKKYQFIMDDQTRTRNQAYIYDIMIWIQLYKPWTTSFRVNTCYHPS